MTSYRIKRHRQRRHGANHFALIPFIDMMTILVVFLLAHTADVDILPNTKNISIPQSISEHQPRTTVVVMLTKDQMFVQGELVDTIADIQATQGDIIEPLRAALKKPMLVGQETTEADLADREITVMGDKSLPYDVLKKVMRTCTDADYGRISLAVLQKDKPVPAGAVGHS